MKTHRTTTGVILAAALALCSSAAQGSGFGLNEHGARAMGLGGAFTAVADGPSAMFFNPAGLAQLNGLQLEAGMTLIVPSASYMGNLPGTATEVDVPAKQLYFPIPNVHVAYRIHERLAAGVSVTVPYGLGMEWPATVEGYSPETAWWGRSIISKIHLQSIFITPTVAVQLHPRVLLGLGVSLVQAAVTLERAVTLSENPADDIDFKLSGDDFSVGATAGLLVKVLPGMLNVGVTYRSGVALNFEGKAAFTKGGSGDAVPAGLRTSLTDDVGLAKLNLPHVISLGVAAYPLKNLLLSLTGDLITWSSYDQLAIDFQENDNLDTAEPKDWNNTYAIRFGAEYKVLQDLGVRLGFIFDKGPIPADRLSPELPDSDRFEFCVGGGYTIKGLTIDLAYQMIFTPEFETGANAPLVGKYSFGAHLAGLSLGYALDI